MTTNQARFDWQDPLNIDSQLTEDERMVRDTWLPTNTSKGHS